MGQMAQSREDVFEAFNQNYPALSNQFRDDEKKKSTTSEMFQELYDRFETVIENQEFLADRISTIQEQVC
jgi:hypothetical protein